MRFNLALLLLLPFYLSAQPPASLNEAGHLSPRQLKYIPDGEDFVILNGGRKFNRALYGGHSGFRLETGDVPEFALCLPRMGGNLSFGFVNGTDSIALNEAGSIECRYRPGSRIYIIRDKLMGEGFITLTALALMNADGAIWKIETNDLPAGASLTWRFGGAADKAFSCESDLEVGPSESFDLKPEHCAGNVFTINKNKFNLAFGQAGKGGERRLYGEFPSGAELRTDALPVLHGKVGLQAVQYILIAVEPYKQKTPLPQLFASAESARKELASRITISTPDPYFNTIGGALSVAADGVWDGETWLHGATGCRVSLNSWRAAYAGDALGWHERARKHFDAYAASQVTRNGQTHHYNMNLCYIDELLWHLNWTSDLAYAKRIWPVLSRHLAWEKRNSDPDNDGLYSAYACIWASDALSYNSGAVTHSTAYNYRANKMAAEIARKIGENPAPYRAEAEKILHALNTQLWMPSRGVWAEFRDYKGKQRLHEFPAVWTVYHAIDSEVADPFQAYQATRYVDFEIPHIPVRAAGLKDEGFATISTTNWMPYSWNINNVAFAEVMHMALAYFQAGRNEEGFKLLKSSVLDGMYLGGSPGNFGQISFYDAARGECYRDSGDPVGVASRVFVQGLFGVQPDAMNGKLLIRPGFPQAWHHAELKTPDIQFSYKREERTEYYTVKQNFPLALKTELRLQVKGDKAPDIKVNGRPTEWKPVEHSVGNPQIAIALPAEKTCEVEIHWHGDEISPGMMRNASGYHANDVFMLTTSGKAEKFYDPQKVLDKAYIENGNRLLGQVKGTNGYHTLFILMKQGDMEWWQPVTILVEAKETDPKLCGAGRTLDCSKWWYPVTLPFRKHKEAAEAKYYFTGVDEKKCEPVAMDGVFNASVTDIYLQEAAVIDDSGVRSQVADGILRTSLGVPFRTPAAGSNIAFTSLSNNYPDKLSVPLSGKASHAYLLMAGSTNHMQCHIVNGTATVQYADGTNQELELVNPQNWCPIEQDFYVDGLAFRLKAPRPYRLHLKSGLVSNNLEKDLKIEGVYGRTIDGGAGTLLEMELDPKKELKSLTIETLSNDIVVGLMGVTLQR